MADDLPLVAQARLSYDDVRTLITAALDHFQSSGVLAGPGREVALPGGDTPAVVLADDDAVAVVTEHLAEVGVVDLELGGRAVVGWHGPGTAPALHRDRGAAGEGVRGTGGVLTDGGAALLANPPAISSAGTELVPEAPMPYRRVFDVVWSGRRHVMMMATQIDRFGNQNISCTGDWARPRTQLIGVRGAPGNAECGAFPAAKRPA